MVGLRLGHYTVDAELGAGGMGVVYRATDTRLARTVAIKVLNERALHGTDAAARLEREARLLASLNHTNIAAIHGLERDEARVFLVLEYVPGDTLAQRLDRGAVPMKEALAIARQVAEALEVAHGRGVIHRDLKPANIKVTPDGQVKVLDFGLAKVSEPSSGAFDAPVTATATAPAQLTREGLVMGTVAYMSPEQASGRPVDQRTDLWAFGCVLYELLTGKLTFAGATTTEVLVGVLDREPDWNALPAATPDNVRHLLRRCLTKDPRCRLHHAADARLELEDTLAGRVSGPVAARPARRRVGRMLIPAAAGLVLGAAVVGVWAISRPQPSGDSRVVRFDIDFPPDAPSSATSGLYLTFSQDSKSLIYMAAGGHQLRRLADPDASTLEFLAGLDIPIPSPDDRQLVTGDVAKGMLVKVSLSGGGRTNVTPVDFFFAGDWGTDRYVYGSHHMFGPIFRAPEAGGEKEWVTELDQGRQERAHRYARLLPGNKGLVFTVIAADTQSFDDARIDVVDLATRTRRTVVQGGTYPRYSPSGHIVYARAGSLFALPFDLGTLDVSGGPVKVLDGVVTGNWGNAYFDISPRGDLVYAAGPAEKTGRDLMWVDRTGQATSLGLPARPYFNPRLSPDGRRLAVEVEGPLHDLYVHDFDRHVTSRLTNDGVSHAPIWTPDGRRLAYRTNKWGAMTIEWMPADRSGPPERLFNSPAWQSAVSFSPDGKYLAYDEYDWSSSAGGDIWVLPLEGDRQPRPVVKGGFAAGAAKFSPDGRWILYSSMESGRAEIYVQSWPGPGAKIQVSSEGGTDPLWRRDGSEIFYRNDDKMMAVTVLSGPGFRAGRPELLWTGDYLHGLSSSCGWRGTSRTSYDVSADGQRFLMIRDSNKDVHATKLTVVINWVEELKQMVRQAAEGRRAALAPAQR